MFGCLKSSHRATNEALPKRNLQAFSAAKARAIYLRDAPLDPPCTGEELCRDAIAEILSRVEIGHR
jgi:hypothetical protein